MSKIYIRTNANNAEKTIGRAIESILRQTYSDFVYYINDNGSSDQTRAIIEKYAGMDSRIVPFYNKENRVYKDEYIRKNFYELTENIDEDDYLCYLDADDEYLPTFLEEVLRFMNENDLDIGICGSEMLSVDKNNLVIGARELPQNLILQGDDFIQMFPVYHQFARAVWGKVYRGHTLKGRVLYPPDDNTYPSYGSDTIETLRAFSKSGRVGILAKKLHRYYVSQKSVSYRLDPLRVVSDQLQHRLTVEYLEKLGPMKQENMDFLYLVYCNAILDTFRVVIKSGEGYAVKSKSILDMITCPITKEMLLCKKVKEEYKKYILIQMAEGILENKNKADESMTAFILLLRYALEGYAPELPDEFYLEVIKKTPILLKPISLYKPKTAYKILNTSYISLKRGNSAICLLDIILMMKTNMDKAEIMESCCRYMKSFPNSIYTGVVEKRIYTIINDFQILKGLSLDFLVRFTPIIICIINNDPARAFELTVKVLESDEYLSGSELSFYYLGQNLACLLNNQPGFLYFKKLAIYFLIQKKEWDKAREELSDFDVLLPEDVEFLEFRRTITQRHVLC